MIIIYYSLNFFVPVPYIVTDPVNIGTYNYGTNVIDHAIEDVIPYYRWGNSEQDTTNTFKRIVGN